MKSLLRAALLIAVGLLPVHAGAASSGSQVVLLHGLLRSSSSMSRLADSLAARGFNVCNVSYPSRMHSIEVLARDYVAPAVERCFPGSTAPVDFVTHSMGGIVVRQLASTHAIGSFGRVVMLAPPNHGSELVDEFGSWWLFRRINGPAGNELGTTAASVPMKLGPAPFEVGIITGDRTTNLVLSAFIPGRNDGKVSVASARLDGMKDFLVIPVSHTFIMRNTKVIDQTIRFLETGVFDHASQPRT
ncbi:MAG TPA: alpha/beta fold hydrolase [Candidatus Limnocylindrales bacterium]|nr:alpha/beta fold hydrolase [Candidatus Limnocylindrales bacterium]